MILVTQKPLVIYTAPDVRVRALSAESRRGLGSSSVISATRQWSVGYSSVVSAVSVVLSAVSAESRLSVGSFSVISVDPRLRLGG